jgi:hypothetical protein
MTRGWWMRFGTSESTSAVEDPPVQTDRREPHGGRHLRAIPPALMMDSATAYRAVQTLMASGTVWRAPTPSGNQAMGTQDVAGLRRIGAACRWRRPETKGLGLFAHGEFDDGHVRDAQATGEGVNQLQRVGGQAVRDGLFGGGGLVRHEEPLTCIAISDTLVCIAKSDTSTSLELRHCNVHRETTQ